MTRGNLPFSGRACSPYSGAEKGEQARPLNEAGIRGLDRVGHVIGTEGQLELVGWDGVRMGAKGQSDWETVAPDPGPRELEAVAHGVADLVDALRTGREPQLSGHRALAATELIFATYESSRRRGRVDLPLTIDDSPLLDMLGRA